MFGFPPRRQPRRSAPKHGLQFDTLEDRSVPAIFSVNTLADGVANHTDSALTLREAIAAISAGDLGALSPGEANQVFGTPGDNDIIQFEVAGTISLRAGELALDKDVVITGPGTSSLVIERNSGAGSAFRIFQVTSSTANVTIEKLTIARGNLTNDVGGGILNSGTLTLQYVTLTQNTVNGVNGFGGAVYNFATLTVNYSTFSGNNATSGGAISADNSATITTINNSTFNGNSASGDGGAILNGGQMSIANSTLGSNTAAGNGGAISNAGIGTIAIVNATIAFNQATGGTSNGGGISSVASGVSLFNSIVAGNTSSSGADIFGTIAAGASNNVIGSGSGGIVNGSLGNQTGIAAAAVLSTTLKNNGGLTNTYALVQNSPALMKGSNTVTGFQTTDQRDAARDFATPDVGAYESHHPLSPVGSPASFDRTFQPRPSSSIDESFIKGLYQTTLLRAPDAAGLAGWLNILAAGASRADVSVGFYNSVENRSNQVTSYYRYFLNREPDAAGLSGWVSQLQTGVSDEAKVMTNFILSIEFSGSNDNASFVNLMYYALLSRQADAPSFDIWKSNLDTGLQTRAQQVDGFLRSQESLGRVVSSFFISYLKRVPDAATQNAFVLQLGSGVSFTTFAVTLLGSEEFYNHAGSFQS